MIDLRHLTKQFTTDDPPVVDDISLSIAPGETFVLLGASGCGKTTLLRMINRLIDLTRGEIRIDGRDARSVPGPVLRRGIGFVRQDIGLFPHLSVQENIAIVPRLLGWPARRRLDRAHELLSLLGLDPDAYASRFPSGLSGGQQQRVAIARALAADPPILLMDEPFAALYAILRDQLQLELLRIRATVAKTIVFVTHDIFEAFRLGDRIAVMRDGRIDQVGAARELMGSPATPFVEAMMARASAQAALPDAGGRSAG